MFSMGVGLFPTEPVPNLVALVRSAEKLGYDNVWIGDSQNIWRESTITMGAAAMETSRIVIGTGVSNLVTRHRSIIASTWATLAELTGGRTAIGLGVGDSSLRTMGLRPSHLAELEREIGRLRALLRGESVDEELSDTHYQLSYIDTPFTIPIYIGASGPKILRLAGRVADGVILLVGTQPAMIEAALDVLETGASESGRSLSDLHLILWTPTAISDSATEARDLVRAHVARTAMRPVSTHFTTQEQASIVQIRSAYNYSDHMKTAASHAQLVPDSLVDRFALAGTPDQCLDRLRSIAKCGIDQIAIVPYTPPGEDRVSTMTAFAELCNRL